MKKRLDLMREEEKRKYLGHKKSLIVRQKELKAFETDDKLYIVNPGFAMEGEIMKKRMEFSFEDSKKTIYQAMLRAVAKYYENCSPSAQEEISSNGKKRVNPFMFSGTGGSILVYYKLYLFYKLNP